MSQLCDQAQVRAQAGFCQCWMAVDGPIHPSVKRPQQSLRNLDFGHDIIMEIGPYLLTSD
jgi:hypothetical protein